MSWVEGEMIFNEKVNKKDMEYDIYDAVEQERGSMKPVNQELILLNNIDILEDINAAREYIESRGSKYWRRANIGVRFFKVTPSKKMLDIERRIKETENKLKKYSEEHSTKNFKAEFVGCPECKSKIRKVYLNKDKCPVCSADLRSATTIKTLEGYRKKIQELQKQLRVGSKACKKEVLWLVSYQGYLG